jgi:hypothetical protein
MRRIAISIFALVFVSIGFGKEHKHAPLSPKLLSARTVYLDNRTGYEKFSDRAYDELQKWGRFRVVDSAKNADLIFLLSASVYHGGYFTSGTSRHTGTVDDDGNVNLKGTSESRSTPISVGYTHLYVIDPQSGDSLWSDTKRWGSLITGYHSATRGLIKELRERIEQSEAR